MGIGIGKVSIVSLFVECILYGFFTFMFAVSIYVLLIKRRGSKERINRPMVVVSFTMFILATVHVGSDLQRLLEAYLIASDPSAYLSKVNTAIYSLKSTAYAIQTLVGDGFMLYRVFLIWGGDKRICLPILICFIASIGVAIGALQGFARASPTAPVFITELHDWIVSFFSLTLFTNFSCTLLIAARILWVHRRSAGLMVRGASVFPAAMIIIESGMIYSACLIILLSLYLSGSFAQYILLDAVTQVIGVVFSLIIVRVGLGISTDAATYTNHAYLSTFAARVQGNQTQENSSGRKGPQNTAHHKNSATRRHVINTDLSSFAVMSGGQTDTTISTDVSVYGEHKKETSTGTPPALGFLPESEETDQRHSSTEGSFHPFDDSGKRSYIEANRSVDEMEYAENVELRDRMRLPRAINQSDAV